MSKMIRMRKLIMGSHFLSIRTVQPCRLLSNQPKKPTSENGSMPSKLIVNVKSAASSAIEALRHPGELWLKIKEEIAHYWLGSKLLWQEIKVTNEIMGRILQGHGMTRRERIQLIRTSTDIFRLVPFAIFIIVPFMELLLPFALKLFPNMLPSTFQDSLKKEEVMKKELQMRLAVAGFMQETLTEMASKKSISGITVEDPNGSVARELIDFIDKARLGQPITNESVIKISRLFKDELTLANIARPQLVSMCQYMSLKPYGADAILRFQLRVKLRAIKEDDRRILWDGIDSLTVDELREACQERGMRSFGLTHFGYKRQLQDWLELSIQKNIPISLLIMSRAFNLSSTSVMLPEDILKKSISALTDDTINEVVLAVASEGETHTLDMRKRKLESIQFQSEMIQEERSDTDDAKQDLLKKKQQVQGAPAPVPAGAAETVQPAKSTQQPSVSDAATGTHTDTAALTAQEMEAIGDLARGSSVSREKAEFAILQAHAEALPVSVTVASSPVAVASSASSSSASAAPVATQPTPTTVADISAAAEDTNIVRIHSVLNSMLDKLKVQIDSTEKALGDKLHMLDADDDGELSAEELKEAIAKILKRTASSQEAEELVQILDRDKDGKVSVVELLQYVEARKSSREVEDLQAQLDKR